MLVRLIAIVGLLAVSACTFGPQPTIRIGSPTPEGTALAQGVCSDAVFTSIDPANPPAEWYECPL